MAYKKNFHPEPDEIQRACRMPLHPDAEAGIELYNKGEFFLAHEALEDAWNAEGEPERRLYQGILQAAVLCMHAQKGNYRGVMSMNARRLVWLGPWPDHCRGLEIGQLKSDIDTIVAQAEELGPDNLELINPALFTTIKRVNP